MNQDLVTELVNALTILPGVGKKSAQRMALYLLDRNKDGASILANTLLQRLIVFKDVLLAGCLHLKIYVEYVLIIQEMA